MTIPERTILSLIRQAMRARENAYAPYSRFLVGAALLAEDDQIYTGCNVECASYPMTQCAERTALCAAVSQGKRKFAAVAIVGAPEDASVSFAACPPCGACRQMLWEFCRKEDLFCILAKGEREYRTYWLSELLPVTFDSSSICPDRT